VVTVVEVVVVTIPVIPVIGVRVVPLVKSMVRGHILPSRTDKLDMVRDKPYHRNATEP